MYVCAGSCDVSSRTCTVSAWCPVETDLLPLGEDRAVLEQVDNFTLLIKNQIYFPKFDKKRSNILQDQNDSYLKSCRKVYGCYSSARQKVCRCDSDTQVAADLIPLLNLIAVLSFDCLYITFYLCRLQNHCIMNVDLLAGITR